MNEYNNISIRPFSSSAEKGHYLLSYNGKYYEWYGREFEQ